MRQQQQYDDLTSRVDEIMCYIKHTSHVLEQDSHIENDGLDSRTAKRNIVVTSNVRKSVHSAEAFVRNTTAIANNLARFEATQAGSEVGFSLQQKATVESWLSSPLPLPPDDIEANGTEAANGLPDVTTSGARRAANPLMSTIRCAISITLSADVN